METKKSGNDSSKEMQKYSIIGVGLVLILWIGSWILINCQTWSQEMKGQFGDMFGAVNALFTGLAFSGVIVTIILQSKELKLQRDELIETRKEFKQQNRTLTYQRFENTFFNLVQQYNRLSKDKVSSEFQRIFKNASDFLLEKDHVGVKH